MNVIINRYNNDKVHCYINPKNIVQKPEVGMQEALQVKKEQYLIIHKYMGTVYCFFESYEQHLSTECSRLLEGNIRLPLYKLNDECNMESYPEGTYFVYEPESF